MVLLWGMKRIEIPPSFLKIILTKNKNPLFTKQKPPFCIAKVWFLAYKKGGFATQKYGCCNVLSIRQLCKRVVFAKH